MYKTDDKTITCNSNTPNGYLAPSCSNRFADYENGNTYYNGNGLLQQQVTHGYEGSLPDDATWKAEPERKCFQLCLKFLNVFGIMYCVTMLSAVYYTNLTQTVPLVYKGHEDLIPSRRVVAYFMLINVIVNYILTMIYNSYYVPNKVQYSGLVDGRWRHCLDCKHLIPPRAHHCPLCKGCILKRDHHCFFIGCCIGYYNQRYFICFLFYVMLGSVYACYLTFTFVSEEFAVRFQDMAWYGYICHFFLPISIGQWLLGYLDGYETYYIILSYLTFGSGLGAAIAFVMEMYMISHGITAYEYSSGATTIGGKMKMSDHFKTVFGKYWYLNFIVPLPWIKPKGNGIDWYPSTKCI